MTFGQSLNVAMSDQTGFLCGRAAFFVPDAVLSIARLIHMSNNTFYLTLQSLAKENYLIEHIDKTFPP